jgi:hypothetical protein
MGCIDIQLTPLPPQQVSRANRNNFANLTRAVGKIV